MNNSPGEGCEDKQDVVFSTTQYKFKIYTARCSNTTKSWFAGQHVIMIFLIDLYNF